MTSISEDFLHNWRERMRQDMLGHPQHHLNWRLRQEFYFAVGNETAFTRQFRGWLAVQCVQRVLPILLAAHPAEREIFDELSACIAFLKGEESPHDVRRLLDMSYHGHWLGILDFCGNPPPRQALAVLMASFKAMQEIKHWDDEYGWLEPLWELKVILKDGQEKVTTDEDWVGLAMIGDAASAAAVTFACSADSTACDPEKLKTFWTWWLDEA